MLFRYYSMKRKDDINAKQAIGCLVPNILMLVVYGYTMYSSGIKYILGQLAIVALFFLGGFLFELFKD